jgi:type I restriction enzyme S subunit
VTWSTATLGEIAASVDYGLTASATLLPAGPRFLRITDIQNDHVDWNNVPFCHASDGEEAANSLAPGDIVFARTGATTGKSFLLRSCPERAVFASYLIRVRPSDQIDATYLSRFFQSENYWAQIRKKTRGAAQPGVNSTVLKELVVPFPPLDEQRRIVAILDQADNLRRKRREALNRLSVLAQAIFNAKFQVSELPRVALTSLASIETGLVDPTEEPYINLPHIAPDNIESHSGELLEYRSAGEDGVFSGKYLFDEGSVLYSKIRPYLNKVALSPGRGVCSADMYVLRPVDRASTREYLWFLLRSADFLRFADKHSGRLSIPKLNRDQLTSYQAPAPKFEQQLEFSKSIGELLAARRNHRAHLAKLDELFASLRHRAFRGEL